MSTRRKGGIKWGSQQRWTAEGSSRPSPGDIQLGTSSPIATANGRAKHSRTGASDKACKAVNRAQKQFHKTGSGEDRDKYKKATDDYWKARRWEALVASGCAKDRADDRDQSTIAQIKVEVRESIRLGCMSEAAGERLIAIAEGRYAARR